ncbi:MAG: HAD family hydrolase [Desulfobacterales bacterium]|nr:HAD family hydrolase [Desulfobacterales bacterium]
MFSAFLFDLDGTILNSKKPFIIAYNRALAKHGLPPLPSNEDSAIRILRNPVELIFPELFGADRCGDVTFIEAFVEDLKEAYGEVYIGNTSLCPNACKAMVHLKDSGNKIGIVTSRLSFVDYILPSLNSLGVGKLVDVIVSSKDVTYTKPSPDPYLLGAKKLGKSPSECVVVGDSPEDILAGKAAGMFTVAYTNGFYTLDELAKNDADVIIDDLAKLLPLKALSSMEKL